MSTEQATLDEYASGIAETVRRAGERRALSAPGADEWAAAAFREIARLASTGREFGADDVTSAIGSAPSPGAAGAVFRGAARSRLIIAVGFRISRRLQRHGGLQRTWLGSEWARP
jgi:hypothetical protein